MSPGLELSVIGKAAATNVSRSLLFLAGSTFLPALVIIFLYAHCAAAAKPLAVDGSVDQYELVGPYLEILEDKTASLTIADITSPRFDGSFLPAPNSVPNFGMSRSAFWFRFTVGGSCISKQWVLLLDQPVMDEVDLYIPKGDGSFEVKSSGDARPMNIREVWSKSIALPLSLSDAETTYYLRAWIPGRAQFPLYLMTTQGFQRKSTFDDSLFSACAGFMVGMAIIGLILLAFFRERSYLFFALYLVSSVMATASIKGYYYLWLRPENQVIYHNFSLFFTILMILTSLLFTRSFLRLKETAPVLEKVFKWLIGLTVILFPAVLVAPPLYVKSSLNLMYITASLFSIAASVAAYSKGFAPARYFLFSRIIVYVGSSLNALKNFGAIEHGFLEQNFLLLLPAMDAAFITLALADHVRMQRRRIDALVGNLRREIDERALAHRVLEEEMAERTRLEQEIVKVADEERMKISQELHDGLCQQLTGARLLCSALGKKALLCKSCEELLSRLKSLLGSAVDHAYELSRGVWPMEAEAKGETSSLKELTNRISQQNGININYCEVGENCLRGTPQMTQIYRIVQEALANAAKHAKARNISVTLSNAPEMIKVEVKDDGVGFANGTENSPGGMGIRIMHHRAGIIGGKLEITETPGGGTTVVCTAPCHGEQKEA